jgi:hypothetical protein
MPLTSSQQQAIKDWISAKAPKQPACPLCGQVSWKNADRLVYMTAEGVIPNTVALQPFVLLSCMNCACCLFLLAGDLGL